jgi:uncharacterized protein (TIRG00374 family)
MTRLRLAYVACCALLLAWCVLAFRGDLAQIGFSRLWPARDLLLWVAALSLLNYGLRALRWRYFFSRLGYRLGGGQACLTYMAGFAFTLLPGKVGEMTRAYYYRDMGIPLSATASAFVVERILDLLVMMMLACLAFGVSGPYAPLILIAAGVVLAILLLLAFVHWRNLATHPWVARLPATLGGLVDALAQALAGARALLRPRPLAAGFCAGLIAWGAEGVGLAVLTHLLPQAAPGWAVVTGIYAIAILAGALSFLPGGLGGTEAVMAALLMAHGYTLADALLLTLLCRVLTLWLAIALGWGSVAMLRFRPAPQKEMP